jgi:hypothetical protein
MKLKSIKKIENRMSYDISVDETNNFFANGILVHNSNAGVANTKEDGLWVQSRSNIITVENDNAGFARYVEDNKQAFEELLEHVRYVNTGINPNDAVYIFGEWAGGNIQKGVAISQIEKSLFIFDVKVVPEDGTEPYHLDSSYLRDTDHRIYNIEDFICYEIDIDFNRPDLVQNELSEITIAIEDLCPVAKHFGFEGIGEGVVWCATVNGHDYRFKVKGELHAGKSKVKTLKPVDVEKMNLIHKIAHQVTPIWRLNQFFNLVTKNGDDIDRKYIGDFIRSVIKDVRDEDFDIIEESGVNEKELNPKISKIAKDYFFEQELL